MNSLTRITAAALTFSAAAFGGLVIQEHYTGTAVIPTKNDRPTVGFGSTYRDDGSPVQMGDTITPPRAVARSIAHIAKDEARLKQCLTGAMHQKEYDILVDFAYQYGTAYTCRSEMVAHTNAGDYDAACRAYTNPRHQWAGGYNCAAPGNRTCPGVWTRNKKRMADCLAAQ